MKRLLTIAVSALIAGTIPSAHAQADYPSGDIELVVPFDPGGGVDITSRIIAETANTLLDGAQIDVVNKSGGGGVVGQTYAANAKPDGHTVLAMTSSVVTNPQMKGASYSIDDFVPVALYNLDPEVIVVPADSRFENVEQFLAAATEAPLNIVVAGVGTSHHMSGLAIERVTDARFNYIPTSGFGQQLQAVLGGHADGALWPLGEATAQVENGGVRLLAVATETRHEKHPDVPTFTESGIDVPIWATFRGLSVPEGTPEEVVSTLSDLMRATYDTEAYREKMESTGFEPVYRDAEGFQKVVDSYSELTDVIIEENGLAR